MKSSLLRALIAIIAGILMVRYREEMVKWLTVSIGVLFFLSGFISIVFYYVMRRRYNRDLIVEEFDARRGKTSPLSKPMIPVVGIGCTILGIILALLPETVADYLVYVFAVILVLGAIGEYIVLITAHTALRELQKTFSTKMSCGYIFYILPTLLLLFGILAILYPDVILSAPFLFLGIAFIIYGLSEMVNAIKASSIQKYVVRNQAGIVKTVSGNGGNAEEAEIIGESGN